MSQFEKRLALRVRAHLSGAAPGIKLQVYRNGRKLCDISEGETYPHYDLASLTKIIFTVPALMTAFDERRWTLETKASDFWPSFPAPGIEIAQLLTHSAGAVWWYPFYREIDLDSSESQRRAWLKAKIESLEWRSSDESVYSDIGMLALGFCLEEMVQKPLFEVWEDLKQRLYPGLYSLTFHPGNRAPEPKNCYAPTENCPWRGRLMQGEVHDENAWALGGVSSHAGLFSSVDDLSGYGMFLRNCLLGASNAVAPETMKLFARRARPPGRGDWALGFMMPSASNASCGRYFSSESIGHTGFTGTSLWYDPSNDLLVTIVSNRVFLGREREDFKRLRPMIHDWVVEELNC
ncbi:MAG TPA: serine hydrolase [Hyphomicrobiales bacterium]|nr:serine hydrolase [Hyphomicrobiales bacterium]